MKKMSKNSGITLIALIITIIALLILAGITINSIIGNNGIISNAKRAKNSTNRESYKDALDLVLVSAKTKFYTGEITDILEDAKNQIQSNEMFKNATVSAITNGKITVTTQEGYMFEVTPNGVIYVGDGETTLANAGINIYLRELYDPDLCRTSSKLVLTIGEDCLDYKDYWVNTKTTTDMRERIFILYSQINGQSIESIMNRINSSPYTLPELVQSDFGKSLETFIYERLDETDANIYFSIGTVSTNRNTLESKSVEIWNSTFGATYGNVSTINDLVKMKYASIYGANIDVDGLANEFNCSPNIVIDSIYYTILHDANNTEEIADGRALGISKVNDVIDEFDDIRTNLAGYSVKKPGSTVAEAYTGPVSNNIYQNGEYKFYVIKDGVETEYAINVTSITGHKSLSLPEGFNEDNYPAEYLSNKKHVVTYHCDNCGEDVDVEEDCNFDNPANYYKNIDNEYHERHEICKHCEYDQITTEAHDRSEITSYDKIDNEHHIIRYHCILCDTLYEEIVQHDFTSGSCICGEPDPNWDQP